MIGLNQENKLQTFTMTLQKTVSWCTQLLLCLTLLLLLPCRLQAAIVLEESVNAVAMGAYKTSTACSPSLSIVKQVWLEGGGATLGSPTAPAGSTLVFLIYVKNTTADTATDKQIFDATASGTDLSDAVDGDVASSQDTGCLPDRDKITIGAVTGQANANLTMNRHSTFALRLKVKVK